MVRKREKDGDRLGEEHVLREEVRWFAWDLLNPRCLVDIQGGSWIFTSSAEEERSDLEMQTGEATALTPYLKEFAQVKKRRWSRTEP